MIKDELEMSANQRRQSAIDSTVLVDTEEIIDQALGDYYECAPYGEQIPDELPNLLNQVAHEMVEICKDPELDESDFWYYIAGAQTDAPWTQLFECIFRLGARHAIEEVSTADVSHGTNQQ